jgi:hypothetical protein
MEIASRHSRFVSSGKSVRYTRNRRFGSVASKAGFDVSKKEKLSLLSRSERRFLGRLDRRLYTVTAVLSRLPKVCCAIINTDKDG